MSMNTLKKTEATGKNISDARSKAAEILGVSEDEICIEVLENATSGFLGMGAKPCKILAWLEGYEEEIEEQPAPAEEPKAKAVTKKAKAADNGNSTEKAEEFLKKIVPLMGVDATISAKEDEDALRVTMEGEKMGLLIGRRGETLDALQYLTSIIVNKDRDEYLRVTLDTENYREKRKEVLEKLANKIADKVVRNRRNMTLEPMNPFERRVIHSALQNHEFVTTSSIGEEPERRVVVSLKK